MLNKYIDKQGVACNVLYNELKNKKLSHAYLIDENNNPLAFAFVMDFVKEIICEDILDEEKKKIICKRIDNENYPEVKVIRPDGMVIKKEQILLLQQEFSRTSIEGSKKIYVICNCDQMRAETANAMLKFLEEPGSEIIAILMTNNYNNLLPTIISRCQKIKLDNYVDSKIGENDEIILNFIKDLEEKKLDLFLLKDNFWCDKTVAKDRELLSSYFDIMIDIYYDILKLKKKINVVKYDKFIDILIDIANKNTISGIYKKINYLLMVKDTIRYNVNIKILLDSVIINISKFS